MFGAARQRAVIRSERMPATAELSTDHACVIVNNREFVDIERARPLGASPNPDDPPMRFWVKFLVWDFLGLDFW